MSLLLAPVQGVGLKLKRYRIYNQQVDLINNTAGGVNPLVINDTTVVNTTATAYTQVKSYNINIPVNDFGRTVVNAVRVQIYGYISAGTGYVEVLINGSAPTVIKSIVGSGNSNNFTNTSSALIFDGIISLLGVSNPYTISIEIYNSTAGNTTYITNVYGYQGLVITSTTPVTIDQQETTNPILDEIGVSYNNVSGLRIYVHAVRYTTADATINGTDNFTSSGASATITISPANDNLANGGQWFLNAGDNNGNDNIPSGYNGSFSYTVVANVGASGDVLIIGSLRAIFMLSRISFPKGPHIGYLITSLDIISGSMNIGLVVSNITGTWTGYHGQEEIIYSNSVSSYTSNQYGQGWLIIDESVNLALSFTNNFILWHLLIEVIE